jgi:hypothetical protein
MAHPFSHLRELLDDIEAAVPGLNVEIGSGIRDGMVDYEIAFGTTPTGTSPMTTGYTGPSNLGNTIADDLKNRFGPQLAKQQDDLLSAIQSCPITLKS